MLYAVDIYPIISWGVAEGIAAIGENMTRAGVLSGRISDWNCHVTISRLHRKSGHDRTLKGQTWTGLLSHEGSAAHENK